MPCRVVRAEGRHLDSSYNRANFLLEFSSRIQRECLKVRYGEGFGGVPLQDFSPLRCPSAGVGERADGPRKSNRSKTVGGDSHV